MKNCFSFFTFHRFNPRIFGKNFIALSDLNSNFNNFFQFYLSVPSQLIRRLLDVPKYFTYIALKISKSSLSGSIPTNSQQSSCSMSKFLLTKCFLSSYFIVNIFVTMTIFINFYCKFKIMKI